MPVPVKSKIADEGSGTALKTMTPVCISIPPVPCVWARKSTEICEFANETLVRITKSPRNTPLALPSIVVGPGFVHWISDANGGELSVRVMTGDVNGAG